MRKPAASPARLRPLDAPRGVQVRAGDHGLPVEVRLDRTALQVEAVRESWRIDDEWWRVPIHRIYHQVVLEDGRVLTLYRDLVDGRWYLHGRKTAPARGGPPSRRVDPARGGGFIGKPQPRRLEPPR